ncbi:MAG TPA: alpha/beta hydrolase, partial [bacterium]|nr:alpha/beta hydrolase [bacterium]
MTERKPPEKTKSPAQVAASCDGISIACETKGAGWPALVFVHGWSCDRTYWDAQVQAFSRLQCPMRLIDCAQFYAEH